MFPIDSQILRFSITILSSTKLIPIPYVLLIPKPLVTASLKLSWFLDKPIICSSYTIALWGIFALLSLLDSSLKNLCWCWTRFSFLELTIRSFSSSFDSSSSSSPFLLYCFEMIKLTSFKSTEERLSIKNYKTYFCFCIKPFFSWILSALFTARNSFSHSVSSLFVRHLSYWLARCWISSKYFGDFIKDRTSWIVMSFVLESWVRSSLSIS